MAFFVPEAIEAAEMAAAAAEEYAPSWASSAGRSAWQWGKKAGQAALYGQGVYQAGKGLYDTGRNIIRGIGDDVHKAENIFSRRKRPAAGKISQIMPRHRYAVGPGPRKRPRSIRHGGVRTPLPKRPKVIAHSFKTMGRYQGSFKRPRNKRKRDSFRVLGSTARFEKKGTTTGADVAEIGHSVCMPQLIIQSMGRSFHRRLWKRFGSEIIDWTVTDDLIAEGNITYSIAYRSDYTVATLSYTAPVAFVTGDTHTGMADKVMTAILALYTTTNDNLLLEEIIYRNSNVSTLPIAKLPLRQAQFCFAVSSILTVQNITESSTGGTDDHTLTTDVRANPVIGRVFVSRSNSFVPVGGITAGYTGNVADGGGMLGDLTGNFIHPKAPNFYQNAHMSGQVRIAPGGIKKSKLGAFKKLGVNRCMRMFRRWLIVNTSLVAVGTDVYTAFGPSRMFHFEHMVKNATDPSVTLAYENTIFIKSYVVYKNKRDALRIEG